MAGAPSCHQQRGWDLQLISVAAHISRIMRPESSQQHGYHPTTFWIAKYSNLWTIGEGRSAERSDPNTEKSMKLSARNQIKGKVADITKGATTSHVRVDVG